jgi:hypothetical protein
MTDPPLKIGQVLLADALWQHAAMTGLVPDAEAALDAADTASRLLPESPTVAVIPVYARLAASASYELAGDRQKGGDHLDAACRLADGLRGAPGSAQVLGARYCVAAYRDGITPPLPRTDHLPFPSRLDDPDVAGIKVAQLWRLGQVEEARALVSTTKSTPYTAQFKVALALEHADGRPAAGAEWNAFVEPEYRPSELIEMIPYLYLTGEAERVPEMARKLRASHYRYRRLSEAEWEIFLRFWEGGLSEADFLKAPMSTRMHTSWRHTIVGMKRLGEGDRDGARQAFMVVYDARTFCQGDWEWCYSFLIRMNSDPEWPRAIPVKKKP